MRYDFENLNGCSYRDIYHIFCLLVCYERGEMGCYFNPNDYEWLIGYDLMNKILVYTNACCHYDDTYCELDNVCLYGRLFDIVAYTTPNILPNRVILCKKGEEEESKYMNQKFSLPLLEYEYMKQSLVATKIAASRILRTKGPNFKELITDVIFNDPATIVFWFDGTKTVVKAEGEKFNPEKGLAMAIAKKYFGNEGNYYDIFKKWLPNEE